MLSALGPVYLYMPRLPMWLHWAIYVALVVVVGIGAALFTHKLHRVGVRVGQWATGIAGTLRQRPAAVAALLGGDVLAQRRVRRDRYGALMHSLIFYSFCVLLLGTTLIGVQHDLTSRFWGVAFLRGDVYLVEKALLDTAGVGLVVGVVMGVWRRYRAAPSQLGERPSMPTVYGALVLVAVSGLVLEATRELAVPVSWGWWSYAGHLVALALGPLIGRHELGAYQLAWGVHVTAAFATLAMAGATALDHLIMVPSNMVLSTVRPAGLVSKPFDLPALLEAEEDLEGLTAGFASPRDLSWDRRLMVDSCLNCGRCEAACPATAAGRPLSPRLLVQALRSDLRSGETGDVFARGVIDEDAIWSCLTCSACRRECPAQIDQPGLVLDLRRSLAERGMLDEPKSLVLSGLERNQNPLGLPSYQRADWLRELGVATIDEKPDADYLYWIGCMASYDERARSIVRSMMAILDHVGITYAVLAGEQCHGESQRRLGDEAGFQMRTIELSEQLRAGGAHRILTHCPHCMNTFVNDYREFGIELEVVHHSQLLAELLASGRLTLTGDAVDGTVAYHDPCNLGRVLGEFAAPRTVVRAAVGDVVEFERHGDQSFCCGAGGANYFYKAPARESVSGLRLAQARDVGAQTVATACPFCLGMLEDAARTSESEGPVRVMDLSELIASRLAP